MPVASIPFNREFAPEGWDYEEMSNFNGGEPDIIFMMPADRAKEFRRFEDYDDAGAYVIAISHM